MYVDEKTGKLMPSKPYIRLEIITSDGVLDWEFTQEYNPDDPDVIAQVEADVERLIEMIL